ncbi:MAG: hypothetical protein M3464_11600 [Chloroflexota bacterium]|nr:hypothetical protein [Chloroflexota bacterium]
MNRESENNSPNILYHGTEAPLPERKALRAGPVTVVLEGADLRYVKVNREIVILRLYAAVRDQSWGTLAPVFTSYELDEDETSFALRFCAEHVSPGEQGVDFAWDGSIVGSTDGTIVCTMDGAARSPFWRNRIGWCVLHPMELAGRPVEIRGGGQHAASAFPERIAPHQPFFDIEAMEHGLAAGGSLRLEFAGDLFETEDQRNWTDASYKTYSTPLRIPYPVALAAGDRVWQSVTVTVIGASIPTIPVSTAAELTVRVGDDIGHAQPPIGVSSASHGNALSDAEIDRFRKLHLGHLHHTVDLAAPDWQGRLDQVSAEASVLGCALELEVLTNDDGQDFNELVAAAPGVEAPIARLTVFPRSGVVSTNEVLTAARNARDQAELSFPIGGGSRAYFTQLNRGAPSTALLDFVAYPINPQVHAFDNASIVETLAAQAETVHAANALTGNLPVAVGPITLRPRINPDAVPSGEARSPGSLPDTVDVRQPSLFAAGWTVGSIRHLASAGVAALTYFETTGWRGLVERSDHELPMPAFHSRPGISFPVYHALADVGELVGGRLLSVEVSDRLAIEALALLTGDRFRLIVVSFLDQTAEVRLTLPPLTNLRSRSLDATTYDLAADDPATFRAQGEPLETEGGSVTVSLRPLAVVTIDGHLETD